MPENMTKDALVNPRQKYRPDAVAAVRALARSKPWQGDWDKRWADMQSCFAVLCDVYGLTGWTLRHEGARQGCSGESRINVETKTVILTGRLSVVSLFFLVALARFGLDGARAMRWSVTLFARRFPISFGRCELVDGLLVNANRRDE